VTDQRLGTVFHESFSLSRPAIKSVLETIIRQEDAHEASNLQETLRDNTDLGTNYIRAMPRYAFGCGLLDENYLPTSFGKLAHIYDPFLEQPTTLWLMHYHLSAPQGPGPSFWSELVLSRFRSGDKFSANDIKEQIDELYERNEGRRLADSSARSTATIFLGTYTKAEGLGKLEILEDMGDDYYRVLEPELPPAWSVACAFLEYWQAEYGNRMTVNLDDLYSPRGLAQLFMIGPSRMNAVLRILQQETYLEVHRVAPPYQVVLLNKDSEPLLEKIYRVDESI
jgi:hypothetical protein